MRAYTRKLKRLQKLQRPDKSHKSLLYAILGVALVVLLLSVFVLLTVAPETPITFQRAVANPKLREDFIAQILKQYPLPPQVKFVRYATAEVLEELERVHSFIPEPDDLMVTITLETFTLSGIGYREMPVGISVFAAMFDASYVQNENDVIATLLQEYTHAKQFNQKDVAGFSYAKDFLVVEGKDAEQHYLSLIHVMWELDAYRTNIHLLASKDWGSSESYIRVMDEVYRNQYLLLLDYFENGPPVHVQVMKRAKIEFFAPWFLDEPVFSLTSEGIPKFTDPNTKKTYILPKEVLFLQESQ